MQTATFVRKLDGWRGDARLYKCDPPMRTGDGAFTGYVVVSAVDICKLDIYTVVAFFDALSGTGKPGKETFIFACDADGIVRDNRNLPGSFKGELDHLRALTRAGYVVEES